VGGRTVNKRQSSDLSSTAPPLLPITPEIMNAAALVAEADAAANGTSKRQIYKRSSFWMENIDRKGSSPWGSNSSYTASQLHMFDMLFQFC
jgi:hypothetical protein